MKKVEAQINELPRVKVNQVNQRAFECGSGPFQPWSSGSYWQCLQRPSSPQSLGIAAYWFCRHSSTHLRILDHCCMYILDILFILRRKPLSGQRDPIWRASHWFWPRPKFGTSISQGMLPGEQDILGTVEPSFLLNMPSLCVSCIIPRHVLDPTLFPGCPRAFKSPKKLTPRT